MYIPSIIAFTNTGISMIIRLLTNFFNRIMNDTIQNGKIKIIKFSCTITDSFLGISIFSRRNFNAFRMPINMAFDNNESQKLFQASYISRTRSPKLYPILAGWIHVNVPLVDFPLLLHLLRKWLVYRLFTLKQCDGTTKERVTNVTIPFHCFRLSP